MSNLKINPKFTLGVEIGSTTLGIKDTALKPAHGTRSGIVTMVSTDVYDDGKNVFTISFGGSITGSKHPTRTSSNVLNSNYTDYYAEGVQNTGGEGSSEAVGASDCDGDGREEGVGEDQSAEGCQDPAPTQTVDDVVPHPIDTAPNSTNINAFAQVSYRRNLVGIPIADQNIIISVGGDVRGGVESATFTGDNRYTVAPNVAGQSPVELQNALFGFVSLGVGASAELENGLTLDLGVQGTLRSGKIVADIPSQPEAQPVALQALGGGVNGYVSLTVTDAFFENIFNRKVVSPTPQQGNSSNE